MYLQKYTELLYYKDKEIKSMLYMYTQTYENKQTWERLDNNIHEEVVPRNLWPI